MDKNKTQNQTQDQAKQEAIRLMILKQAERRMATNERYGR